MDIMGLQAASANLHTDQDRDYFMQRSHDVISSFGGKTSYDADNRPLLVMRSNLWASGYDVDGTDQTSLAQFSRRVQQTYKHSVPRFFVPEHGTMFTLALVRLDRKSGSAGMPRPISYAVFCLKKKKKSKRACIVLSSVKVLVIETDRAMELSNTHGVMLTP